MANAFFGIDLGTTQCSVAYVIRSARTDTQTLVEPTLIELSGQGLYPGVRPDVFPSIVGRDWTDGRKTKPLFGVDFLSTFALRKRSAPALRRGSDFFTSVKSDLGTRRVYPFSMVPGIRTPRQATAALLRRLAELTHRSNPDLDPLHSHVVVTVPASLSGLAREETLGAASDAGYTSVELLDEPVAALLDTLNHQDSAAFLSDRFQHVLVFDYGGGTCDLALMKAKGDLAAPTGIHIETLAISPYNKIGGDDIDRAIVEHVLLKDVSDVSRGSPEWRALVDTLSLTVAKRLKESLCEQLVRDQNWRTRRKLPQETITLPFRFETSADLPRSFALTALDFERVMEAFVAVPEDYDDPDDSPLSVFRPVIQTLQRAGLRPRDLTRLILHGGSSLNPFVKDAMAERLGTLGSLFESTVVRFSPSPLGSVARGAALSCYWKHARGHELVAPILGEPLGIITSGGEPEELLPAGVRLPFPNDLEAPDVTGTTDRFFVPDGLHTEILVPYYAGVSGPDQAARHAGTIRLAVPAGTSAGSPIRVRLRVDRDKTVRWWFMVADGQPIEAPAVKDPWTSHVPTREERALAEHRRTMNETAESDSLRQAPLLIQEASLLRLAGYPEEALITVTDVIELLGGSPSAHNMRALCLDDLSRQEEALQEFRLAASLNPEDPVLVGNLGCALDDAGHLDEAIARIREALTLNGDLGYLYERLARIARKRGDEAAATRELRQAERCYQLVTERFPLSRKPWLDLWRVRQALGDYEGAERAKIMALDIDHVDRFEGKPDAVILGPDALRT